MNRQIKFRGLRADSKGWVYGSLVNNLWVHSEFAKHEKGSPVCEIITGEYEGDCWDDIVQESDCIVTVIPESVGQFTGLKDKNRTDIYEGHTVKFRDNDNLLKVVFDNGGFRLANLNGRICVYNINTEFLEIIENKDLIQ